MHKYFLLFFLSLLGMGYGQKETMPNIIFFIGDGMGLTQISTGMYANGNSTELENFEYVGLSKTHATKNLVTDSAASGTAMASGVKTYNGVIGISAKNEKKPSILDYCSDKGYQTGLLSTSSIVHATPASLCPCGIAKRIPKIAYQLMESNVNYFIGGGKKHFTKRDDRKNLLKSSDKRYEIVNSLEEFIKSDADKIGYFTYDDEPPKKSVGRKPGLPDMLQATLDKFSKSMQPFFVMTEGSQIDWGGHANEVAYVVSEFWNSMKPLKLPLRFAKKNGNTLVVVTADHETGGLALTKGNVEKSQVGGRFSTKGHSATMVPVFSYGPSAKDFSGIYDNTALYGKLKKAVDAK